MQWSFTYVSRTISKSCKCKTKLQILLWELKFMPSKELWDEVESMKKREMRRETKNEVVNE